jgi:hypothetical protein
MASPRGSVMFNESTSMFFGKPPEYWLELDQTARGNNYEKLIMSNALLRSKVNFYEEHVREMKRFMFIMEGKEGYDV